MRLLGLTRTKQIANAYNRVRNRRDEAYRRALYERHFDELVRENGTPTGPVLEMEDGWALDTSGTFPHTDALIEQGLALFEERGGVVREHFGRPFFQDVLAGDYTDAVLRDHPALLDFITSSEVLTTAARYLGTIPHLANANPRGVRLNESDRRFDDEPDAPPRASQKFHIDPYSRPNVYVLVALHDVTEEHGPFCWLGAEDSQRVAERLHYGDRGVPYRLSDEEVYQHVDPDKLMRFTCPAGSVLFVDSSACMHYGSRDCRQRRRQVMYSLSPSCRTDFAYVLTRQWPFPVRPSDSRLRKMVLDRTWRDN
ncbi:MAG: hypothetical protein R3362_00075 [Rhodothermales bacterium]|nr:hypothetical protein [Rhodothermales bacterium]